MNEYEYDGPVMHFEHCLRSRWRASTYAVSKEKAKNNLSYRYKKEHGLGVGSKITLPGKMRVIN